MERVPQADLDRERIRRRGFSEFVRRAWSTVDTSPLVWSWHLDAICEHLEAVTRREIRDLVINVPPGFGKSLLVSVLWPVWVWTVDPQHRWIAASYAGDGVALRDARRARSLVESRWYQERWPHVRFPRDKTASTSVSLYYTTAGGMRYTTTVRGAVTGQHGDTHVIDDPVDPAGANAVSGRELDEVNVWDSETMSTRFRDHRNKARVLVMQRLHARDLSAQWIKNGATVLCLPLRFERDHPHRWPRDPRTNDGELLDPVRMPEAQATALEKSLGPYGSAAQAQQRPAPREGGIFKVGWWKFWTELPAGGTWALSVDCAFKETETSSFVVVQAWYQHGPNFYLVDQTLERMGFERTVAAIRAMAARYPKARRKLVEAKANGAAVVDVLKRDLPGLVLVEPMGGKEARAHAIEPLVSAGNVFLPDPDRAAYDDGRIGAAWVRDEFLPEANLFPRASTDDQIDTMTQLLNELDGGSYLDNLRAAVKRQTSPA
jgi:predicted phage terminase large subunit-like protein